MPWKVALRRVRARAPSRRSGDGRPRGVVECARTMNQQLLDPIPIPVIVVALALVMLLAYEIGFRIGRWWQDRTPDESEGPGGVLVGSLLGLLAFMLAITMG